MPTKYIVKSTNYNKQLDFSFNTGACEIECPKGISLENIARMNREYLSASLK